MNIILTHEQADMDALASQLGVWFLYPESVPVLPRSINRNGRRFLERFGDRLPFIQPEDLPKNQINRVILVDTQSLITVKGMHGETQIIVYDHHPQRDGLDPDWELHLVDYGANTTQLIQMLQDADIKPESLHASLLALGLYEDTGSFTYGSTTPADLKAASFCLTWGADLDLISEYLYPPLSDTQRQLYDRLLPKVQTHHIKDQLIMTAKADGLDVPDEISSVAHKLRDVLNPDALLILVATTQGIRLVARSTSDQVDVSSIAEAMGGGGHKRAASALIRQGSSMDDQAALAFLDEQYQKMISGLPRHIQAASNVSAIMSKDPLLLAPNTSVHEAHRLMQRYGYEGYPVVANGQVVGLLNRREVDRAISHRLELNVESLMTAGDIHISPDASLEELQALMAASDWGQVPVIEPVNNEIIGIVTRTDLIKTLTPKPDIPSKAETAKKLTRVVPPVRLALLHALAAEAAKINLPVYVVGGFVRDLLLDRPSLDFDVVVEGDAIFFANRLAEKYGGRVLTHHRFGTAKWHVADIRQELLTKLDLPDSDQPDPLSLPRTLDLITARTEFYEQPAALPTVESSSIKMDLHRRDFTINTLALRLDGDHYGTIQDYWGGLSDLHKGHIRVLHALSFVDDATRLLRAVRFEQRFNFEIEPRTLGLMGESLPLLHKLTGARIRHEINLILAEPKAPDMLARLAELDILNAIHPALPWDADMESKLRRMDARSIDPAWGLPDKFDSLTMHQTLSCLVWLGGLPRATIQSVASRLRFKRDLKDLLVSTSQLSSALVDLVDEQPSVVVRKLEKIPRLAIYAACLSSTNEQHCELLHRYVREWASVDLHTTGDDLRAMGLPQSPAYGEILAALRDAWLDGEVKSVDDEKQRLSKLIAEQGLES